MGLDINSLFILCEGSCTSPHEEPLDDTVPSIRRATFKILLARCGLLDDSCVTGKAGLRLSKGKALGVGLRLRRGLVIVELFRLLWEQAYGLSWRNGTTLRGVIK